MLIASGKVNFVVVNNTILTTQTKSNATNPGSNAAKDLATKGGTSAGILIKMFFSIKNL